jgi:hypothetical protein
MKWFIFLASVLAASPAFAQRVYNLPAGSYVITGEVRAVGPVISPDGPVVPPPVVPPPVVPDDASKVTADLIKAMPASDTRYKNSIKLAGTLRLLADQAKERQLDSDAIVGVYPQLMAIAVPDADWKPIHAAILEGLKKCPSPAVCASVLEQYAAGAMSTVPSKADPKAAYGASSDEIAAAAAEYGFDWASIMEILLPLLLKLLMEWLSYVQYLTVLIC